MRRRRVRFIGMGIHRSEVARIMLVLLDARVLLVVRGRNHAGNPWLSDMNHVLGLLPWVVRILGAHRIDVVVCASQAALCGQRQPLQCQAQTQQPHGVPKHRSEMHEIQRGGWDALRDVANQDTSNAYKWMQDTSDLTIALRSAG